MLRFTRMGLSTTVLTLAPSRSWVPRSTVGDEVVRQLDLLHRRGVDYFAHTRNMEPLPVGDERTKHANSIFELCTCFEKELSATPELFAPYIRMAER
jgi:hypothetical protein